MSESGGGREGRREGGSDGVLTPEQDNKTRLRPAFCVP